MDLIKTWVIGVIGAAMVVAAADSLIPAGTVKHAAKFTGGIVLLIAVLSPLVGLDYTALAMALSESRLQTPVHTSQEAGEIGLRLMKTIIAEQTGAYILDKAKNLGVQCSVEVLCRVSDDNLPYPAAVTITGSLTEGQRKELSRMIEAELAITPENQTFENGDVE